MSQLSENSYVQMVMFVLNSLGSSQIAQIAIIIFLGCSIWVRYGGKKNKYLSLKAVQNAAIVAGQYFAMRSRNCKMSTLQVFRWAATNYGIKNFYRDFRFAMYFKPRQHVKYLLTNWFMPEEDTFLLQLTIKPKHELYCSIVNQRQVQKYKQQHQILLSAFSDVKQKTGEFQMCESFNGLIELLQRHLNMKTLLSFTLDNNQLLLYVTNINQLQSNTQQLFKIAEKLKNLELTDQQLRQNKKSVDQKHKFEKQMAAHLRTEREEEEIHKKIEEIHTKLIDDDVTDDEKKNLEKKLQQYKTKLQEKAQKAYAKELGLGNMFGSKKGKNKNIIMRK